MKGHEDIVSILLSYNADVQIRSLDGSTALTYGKFIQLIKFYSFSFYFKL